MWNYYDYALLKREESQSMILLWKSVLMAWKWKAMKENWWIKWKKMAVSYVMAKWKADDR